MGLTESDQSVSMQGVTLLINSMLFTTLCQSFLLYSTSVYETRGRSTEQSANFRIH